LEEIPLDVRQWMWFNLMARLYIIIVFEDSSLKDIRIVKSSAMVQYHGLQDLMISILLILIFWDMRKMLLIKLLQLLEMIW